MAARAEAAAGSDSGAERAGPSRRSSWEGAAAGKCSQVRGSPAGVPGNREQSAAAPGLRGRLAPGCVEHVASPGTSGAGGEGAAAPPAAGRPPHCEVPAGRAGTAAARQTRHLGGGEDRTRLSHKRQPSRLGAPRPYRLSFPSNLLGTRADARSPEMPLLHRKPFVRQKPPGDLRPDEEVFYCKVTNEIFRHYE